MERILLVCGAKYFFYSCHELKVSPHSLFRILPEHLSISNLNTFHYYITKLGFLNCGMLNTLLSNLEYER
jgi:hypothetical protein